MWLGMRSIQAHSADLRRGPSTDACTYRRPSVRGGERIDVKSSGGRTRSAPEESLVEAVEIATRRINTVRTSVHRRRMDPERRFGQKGIDS